MANVLSGFKAFIMRGNLIELAVAFVIGLAFVNVINSLVSNLITPIVAMIVGETSLRSLDFEINDAIFFYGAFLDDLIQFVAIAAAVYFFIVVPYNAISARMKRGEAEPDATTKACPECLSMIPVEARRCAYCAQPVTA
jgi:large conductance mechanosensitive channel